MIFFHDRVVDRALRRNAWAECEDAIVTLIHHHDPTDDAVETHEKRLLWQERLRWILEHGHYPAASVDEPIQGGRAPMAAPADCDDGLKHMLDHAINACLELELVLLKLTGVVVSAPERTRHVDVLAQNARDVMQNVYIF